MSKYKAGDVFTFPCGCKFNVIEDSEEFPLLDFNPDPNDLNLECELTWDLIGKGNTKGVFQLESPLGRTWSKKLAPENIEQLSALVAILRPGCLEAMRDGKSVTKHYVDRKNGEEPVEYYHPALEPLLGETFGEMIYQEQAMHIARDLAGFDLQQADVLRKAIGKKLPEVMAKVKGEFLEGCKNMEIVTDEEAEQIFGWIEKSQRYSFNKSHSVSYAINAYMSAYAKAHFRRAFFTSYLYYAKEKQKPFEEIAELINNAKTMGVDVLPPDFRILNEEFKIWNSNIHFGMFNIKGIGMSIVEKLRNAADGAEKRLMCKRGKWSWPVFLVYYSQNVTSTAVKNMIMSGALDYFGVSRTQMLYDYDLFSKLTKREIEWAQAHNVGKGTTDTLVTILEAVKASGSGKGNAMANKNRVTKVAELLSLRKHPPRSMVDSDEWAAQVEESLLGISLTTSVVESCDKSDANATCMEATKSTGGRYDLLCVACKVDEVKEITDKNKRKMAFLTVSDASGQLECVAFQKEWKSCKRLCTADNTIMAIGKKGKDGAFVINKIRQLNP